MAPEKQIAILVDGTIIGSEPNEVREWLEELGASRRRKKGFAFIGSSSKRLIDEFLRLRRFVAGLHKGKPDGIP